MTPPSSLLRPNSFRIRFAYRFVRALRELNKQRPTLCSPEETYRWYQKVKMAANASMASAAGPKRLWSRAMLWKIRNQARGRRIAAPSLRRRRARRIPRQFSDLGQANQLKRLVPGGEAMDIYSLLGETAHYIECLSTQVQVMKNIVEHCSS